MNRLQVASISAMYVLCGSCIAHASSITRFYQTPEHPYALSVRVIAPQGDKSYLTEYVRSSWRTYLRENNGDLHFYSGAPFDAWSINAASLNGSTLVGTSRVLAPNGGRATTAHLYRESEGFISLGGMQGYQTTDAVDVSYDGNAVIGEGYTPPLGWSQPEISRPFYWTAQTGRMDLPQALPDGSSTSLKALSGDGRIAVGVAGGVNGGFPITWSPDTGYSFLPTLAANGDSAIRVSDISKDGSTIIGSAVTADGQVIIGCYWDADGLLHSFSDGWTNMSVEVVNGDGSVIVGTGRSPGPNGVSQAWIRTPETGVMRLTEYLRNNGVALTADELIVGIRSISDDGKWFGGSFRTAGSFTQHTFIASVPSPGLATLGGLLLLGVGMRRRR